MTTGVLTTRQADGLACVQCGRDWLDDQMHGRPGVPHEPVGRSNTGSQIFACKGDCAHSYWHNGCGCPGPRGGAS